MKADPPILVCLEKWVHCHLNAHTLTSAHVRCQQSSVRQVKELGGVWLLCTYAPPPPPPRQEVAGNPRVFQITIYPPEVLSVVE